MNEQAEGELAQAIRELRETLGGLQVQRTHRCRRGDRDGHGARGEDGYGDRDRGGRLRTARRCLRTDRAARHGRCVRGRSGG